MNNMTFNDAIQPIMNQYAKRRISAFAKRNNVSIDDVEVINEIPVEQLEKEFKRANNIKTRLYKNMNEEQQKAWELYYNEHKQLSLKVKNMIGQNDNIEQEPVMTEVKPTIKQRKTTNHKQPTHNEKNIEQEPVKPTIKHRRNTSNSHDLNINDLKDEVVEPKPKTHRKHHSASKNNE